MKKGKIKFSTLKNNRGVKIDGFRLVYDVKDKQGDWQLIPGFPDEMSEMEFYFPFTKMQNNIKIAYSGYTQLPMAGKGSQKASYFVVSEGVGCPIVAKPDGHAGKYYDGVKENITLTEKHLSEWKMVKKRMTVFLTPIGWSPNEYVVWNTTSEIAIDSFTQEYINMTNILGTDLSMIPLTFRAVGKSGKSKTGINYRMFIGSIGAKRGLNGLAEGLEKREKYKKLFNISALEKQFEEESFFYEEAEELVTPTIPEGYVEQRDSTTGEIKYVNKDGEVLDASPTIDYGDLLAGFVNKNQAKNIVTLAIEQNREQEIVAVNSTANALALLNSLQSAKNAA